LSRLSSTERNGETEARDWNWNPMLTRAKVRATSTRQRTSMERPFYGIGLLPLATLYMKHVAMNEDAS
jgi:hypothetical protein